MKAVCVSMLDEDCAQGEAVGVRDGLYFSKEIK
jgi:hypothetical protein